MDSPRGTELKPFQAYFNSAPSTPRSGDGEVPKSGAQFYSQLMEGYHRRLRKPAPFFGNDAAGLLRDGRYHGRGTPLRGKGSPPPDNKEPTFQPSKRAIYGRSYAAAPLILAHNPSASVLSSSMESSQYAMHLHDGQDPDAAGMRPMSAFGERPCLKMTEQSHKGGLQGSGLTVIQEAPSPRAMRKAGTSAPSSATKARVLVLCEDVAPDSGDYLSPRQGPSSAVPVNVHGGGAAWEGWATPTTSSPAKHQSPMMTPPKSREAMLNNTWERHTMEASGALSAKMNGGLDYSLMRPSTAPGRGQGETTVSTPSFNEARRRYQEVQVANLDVFHYRHSGGICPEKYKLDATRHAAPQITAMDTNSAREAYFASRTGYATNRVRGLISEPKYG